MGCWKGMEQAGTSIHLKGAKDKIVPQLDFSSDRSIILNHEIFCPFGCRFFGYVL